MLIHAMCLVALSATSELSLTKPVPDTWPNRARFYFGVRGGLAIPPGADSLAPNVSLEMGVAPSTGFGIGIRAMWMNNPPGVPFLNLGTAQYGFGALADVRYYIETVEPLIIYPTIAVGFLAGPDRRNNTNLVLPLFNPGLGAKLKFKGFYVAFEFGVSGLTIPFMALTVGAETPSRLERDRVARAERSAPPPVVTPPMPVTEQVQRGQPAVEEPAPLVEPQAPQG